MSTVDERVVILEFNNAQFETNVKQSVSTLQKLKESLNLEGSAKGLDELNKSARSFSLNHVADNIQTVADRFSALGIVGDQVLRRLTDKAIDLGKSLITAIPNQIITGGKRRAQNIEQAKFMLEGLLGEAYDWEKIQEDINYAVSGTAYGFDEAASAAGQLAASSVEFGDDMKAALRGISGVAAMTNDEYGTIAQIFTKIAGQGKVMSQELNQLAAHGINAAATLAQVFGTTEADIRDMVKHGEVDFQMFSYAMDDAFGEHAKNANATFQGVLRNVKASLSRMGEQFATPAYDNLRLILVNLLPVMKDIEAFIKPISAAFKGLAETISGTVAPALFNLHEKFAQIRGLETDYSSWFGGFADKWKAKLTGHTIAELQDLGLIKDMYNEMDALNEKAKKDLKDKNDVSHYDSTIAESYMNGEIGYLEALLDSVEEGQKISAEAFDKSISDSIDKSTKKVNIFKKTFDDLGKSATRTGYSIGVSLGNFKLFSPILDNFRHNAEIVKNDLSKSVEDIQKRYEEESKGQFNLAKWQDKSIKKIKATRDAIFEYGDVSRSTYKELDKAVSNYIKQGVDQKKVDSGKAAALDVLDGVQRGYGETIISVAKGEKKQSLLDKVRNKLYNGTAGALGKMANAAANFLGLNKENVKALASEEQMQQVVDDLADRTWRGEFGNGQDRINALGKLGAAYSIVQNRVNELLGCEKRHTVTAEDEAMMMDYVCETLGITSSEGKRLVTILDGLNVIFEVLTGALEIIKEAGMAIWDYVLYPFLRGVFQIALVAIIEPLKFIGERLLALYDTIEDGAITKFFEDFAAKVSAFWTAVQELEGVKALTKAWSNFKKTLGELVDKIIGKATERFSELQKTFNLPDASFFLGILDSISKGLTVLVDILSKGAENVLEFFDPLFDWIVSIPSKIQEFWASLWGGGEGEEATNGLFSISTAFETLKTNIDAFVESVAPLKAAKDWIKGIWDNLFGKNENKKGIPKKIQQELDSQHYTIIDAVNAIKERVTGVVDAIAPLKAVKDWMKDFWNTIFGTPGEGEDPESYGFGAAFDKLKQQISDFMDSVPILKTIKDWFSSIFNEGLSNSITDIGKAISDFFKAIFDKQEEGEGEPLPFGERFIQAAERLKEKIVQIFGSGPELGKLLMTGGGLGAGIFGVVKLISSLKGNQNGGIAGAIFGSARGGVSKVPAIIGGLLGISAALNMFGVEFKKTTKDGEKNVLFIEFVWDKLVTFLGDAVESIKSLDIGGKIYELIFGSKKEQGGKDAGKGIVGEVQGVLQSVVDNVKATIGTLFGDKNGKVGFGGAVGIVSAAAGIYVLITAFRGLAKFLGGVIGTFTGAAGALADIRVALQAYTDNLRANTLLSYAESLAKLAFGLALLSLVPQENLNNVVKHVMSLTVVIGGLLALFKWIELKQQSIMGVSGVVTTINSVLFTFINGLRKAFLAAATMSGIGLLFMGLALAVGTLVGAISKLANMPNLGAGMAAFAGIAIILSGIVIMAASLASLNGVGFITAIAGISIGLIALAEACNIFTGVDVLGFVKSIIMIAVAASLLARIAGTFASVGNEGAIMLGIDLAAIAAGLLVFAFACKVLQQVDLFYVGAGIVVLGVALYGLNKIASHGGLTGKSGLGGVGVMLLGLAVACVIMGKNAIPAAVGVLLLAGAFAAFSFIASKLTKNVNLQMITFSKSLLKLGIGVLALAVAFPILGLAVQMVGKMFIEHVPSMVLGTAAFVGLLFLLGTVSGIVAPELLILGKSLIMIAIALNLIIGVFTNFRGIRGLISELAGGIGDILGSIIGIPGNILGLFTGFSRAAKETGNDYVAAADQYKKALTTIEGIPTSTAAVLAEKLEALSDFDGSNYILGIKDLVGYIRTLNIDEEQKHRVIRRTLLAAEQQQKEKYWLTVYNIELKLRENGADQPQIDAVFNSLQNMFDRSPGAITAKILSIHTLIDDLNLNTKDATDLKLAVDSAIQAKVDFQVHMKNLKAIINESTNLTAEGKEQLEAKVDEFVSNWTIGANLEDIEAWIKTSGIDVKNKIGFRSEVIKALKDQSNFKIAMGMIEAVVDNATEIEIPNKDEVMEKINTALSSIYKLSETAGNEEEIKAEINNLKANIASLYPEISWDDDVETELETYLNNAFDQILGSYEGYHVALDNIDILLSGSGATAEQKKAFRKLLGGLGDKEHPQDIGKLWLECKELGMKTEDLVGFMSQLGITLNAAAEKEITLSNVKVTMEKAEIPEEQQEAILGQLKELNELPDEVLNDAAAFTKARQEAINKIAAIVGDKATAVQMVNEWYQEKKDLSDASVGVLEGLLETVVFGTDFEASYWTGRVQEMYGLYGNALTTAMDQFVKDIKDHSSLSEEDKNIIAKQAGAVIDAQSEGMDAAYRRYLDLQQKQRREKNIGAFAIDFSNSSRIAGNTAASELLKETLKDFKGTEFLMDEYFEFVDRFNSGEYSWEQFASSFEGTGLTDEQIAAIFFPNDINTMEATMEGYYFIKRYMDPYLDGSEKGLKAYQEEVAKFGHFDFGSVLKKYTDEEDGKLDFTELFGYDPGVYSMKDAQARLSGEMEILKKEAGKEFESFEEVYDWFYNENNGKELPDAWFLSKIMESIKSDIAELTKDTSDEEADQLINDYFGRLNRTIHAVGDGIVKSSNKTTLEIEKAYNDMLDASTLKPREIKEKLNGLRQYFDPDLGFGSNGLFYDFLHNAIFGVGVTEGLDIEALLNDENLDAEGIMNEYVGRIVQSMIEGQIDPQQLIRLYKEFPSVRKLFQDYLKENKEESEQLGDEWNSDNINKLIEEQITNVQTEFEGAIQKAGSGNEKEAKEGFGIIQELLGSGRMTQAELNSWLKEMDLSNLDFSQFAEELGLNIEGMDASAIQNAVKNVLLGGTGASDSWMNGTFFDGMYANAGYAKDGLIQGMEDNADSVYDAASTYLGQGTVDGTAHGLQAESPSKKMKQLGIWAVIGLRQGVIQNKKSAIEAFGKMAEQCVETVKGLVSQYTTIGSDSAINYGTGVVSHPQYINLAGATIVRQAVTGAKTEIDGANGAEAAGKYFVDGFVKGLSNPEKLAEVGAAATAIGATANENLAGVTKEQSPSKVTIGYGRYFSMGFAIGIRQFGGQIESASREVANNAITALGNPLAAVQNVLDSDLDYDPTIRPVMDITGIQNGVKTINGMMPNTKVGLDFISNSMNRVKTTNEDVVSAITGLSKQMEGVKGGDSYTVNGVTYDDGSNISTAVKSLIQAARVERRR